ncbi:Transcriptional regulatory protein NatR [termite gut metagenome]|uniref:Transcriptional regulatory protein NatR n=1 Tax=termite gut metagenome TaxID=433724 RepID=A0A5J4SXR1_9ZZZZ
MITGITLPVAIEGISRFHMPGTNGIEFSKTIGNKTLVIFTTAYAEYALDSYEVDTIDYLVKPVTLNRFQKAVEKAKNYLNDITFIESLKDYVIVHASEQKIIALIGLKNIQSKLPENTFVRVSKSYVVNIKHIFSLDNNDIHIGNAYRDQFFEQFVSKKVVNG